MTIDREIIKGFMNLHDAFLNASLQRSSMLNCPLMADPEEFHISDRARFERAWVAFLYVLVEAWQSEKMGSVRSFVASTTPIDKLKTLLMEAEHDGRLDKMKAIRHYMCHRDRREYWDDGRSAVAGELHFHESLHMAFSEILHAVFRWMDSSESATDSTV